MKGKTPWYIEMVGFIRALLLGMVCLSALIIYVVVWACICTDNETVREQVIRNPETHGLLWTFGFLVLTILVLPEAIGKKNLARNHVIAVARYVSGGQKLSSGPGIVGLLYSTIFFGACAWVGHYGYHQAVRLLVKAAPAWEAKTVGFLAVVSMLCFAMEGLQACALLLKYGAEALAPATEAATT